MLSFEFLLNAVTAGLLVGGLYAALSMGMSISFGMLNIVNIAHPVFFVLGGYGVILLNHHWGLDPILSGLILAPLFFIVGVAVYQIYYTSFERRGAESLKGLVFFFGLLFLLEVSLQKVFGVDFKSVQASWIGRTISVGFWEFPSRLLYPFCAAVLLTLFLHLLFTRTYLGLVSRGVSQDSVAVRLVGANPTYIKRVGFGLSIATTSVAGALLVSVMPIAPYMGRQFIGRVFAVAVMAGAGSIKGTLASGIILGVAESVTASFGGPAWATAVSFAFLLLLLAVRPSGLFRS